MGSQAGATPSSSSSVSTPGPAATSMPTSGFGVAGNVGAGFGGTNSQSMANQQPNMNFNPPATPWQNAMPYPTDAFSFMPMPMHRSLDTRRLMTMHAVDPAMSGIMSLSGNPVLDQQQRNLAEQARQTQTEAAQKAAEEASKLNQNFYSWGSKV
jgi:hypothetical protein